MANVHVPALLFRLAALVLVCLLMTGLAFSITQASGGFSINWYTLDGGGTTSSGGTYTLMGTIGQPDAGLHSEGSGTYDLTGGFWSWVARYLGFLPMITKP